jgi:hypothetical protein
MFRYDPISTARLLRRFTFASAFLFSCIFLVHNAVAGSPPQYELSVTDRPDQRRFVIALHSMDKRPLCLPEHWWPNKWGEIGSPWVAPETSSWEGTLKPRAVNFGLLGPNNVIRIEPGNTITAFIGYEQFGTADRIATFRDRKLRIQKDLWEPEFCSGGK